MNHKLVLKHIGNLKSCLPGTLALHDKTTGKIISGQESVVIDNKANRVTVTFILGSGMLEVAGNCDDKASNSET